MTKPYRFIPLLIVAINALAIAVRWASLPDPLSAHYNLQGEASGTMPRNMLFLYLLLGVAICLVGYLAARKKPQYEEGIVVLTSGVCLALFSSTLVTLTSGTMPIFMLAEPVIVLLAVVGAALLVVKSRKKRG